MSDLKLDSNFVKLADNFREIERKAPGKIYERMDKLGNYIKKEAKEVSPYDKTKKKLPKKHMKNRWERTRTEKTSNGYEVKVRSKAPHFHLVERGHQVVPRRATVNKKTGEQNRVKHSKNAKTFVKGSHFFEKTLKDKKQDIDKEFEKMYDELLKDAFGSW